MSESKHDLLVRCPVCRAPKVQRAHLQFFIEYVALIALCVPYRCRHCFARFIRPIWWNAMFGTKHGHKSGHGSRHSIRTPRQPEEHGKPSGQ